jgi:NADPH2:quinone reductase
MAENGDLRPIIDQKHFEFEDVADAHTYLESGEAIGKVVLTR